MQHNVYLQGDLGERFGHKFSVNVASGGDIFKCISANRPDFRAYVMECIEKDIAFNIKQYNKDLDEKDLLMPLKKGDITISIIPAGSKSGLGKILGAIVIGFIVGPLLAAKAGAATGYSIFTGGAVQTAGFMGMSAATVTSVTTALALNLASMGIQQLMAQDPAQDENPTNYLFNGTTSTSSQGDPVPVLYGELRVPGTPISFDIINGVHINPGSVLEADGALSVQQTNTTTST